MSFLKCIMLFFAIILINPTNSEEQRWLIYILQWTFKSGYPWIFWNLEIGQEAFISRNCSFKNCYITHNRSYLESILDFDVLLFNVEHLVSDQYRHDLPHYRSELQQYVLTGWEPAKYYPISFHFNDFFNLTWMYKLTSDIIHPYFVVKNKCGNIIGPKVDMHWTETDGLALKNTSVIQKLLNKRIAAAWVTSQCGLNRDSFTRVLRSELFNFGHRIDIYGNCGNMSCPKIPNERNGLLTNCYNKIESDYYFYLAFENSITEDYVTEKVLHGLRHYSVPIVYGGADYTRFVPDGIYLNAFKLGAKRLAKEINDIINDPPRYYDFSKWHDYYSFHDTAEDHHRYGVCEFCALLNKKNKDIKDQYIKILQAGGMIYCDPMMPHQLTTFL